MEHDRRSAMAMLAAGTALLPAAARAAAAPASCDVAPALDRVAALLLDFLPETAAGSGAPGALDGGPLARRMDDHAPATLERYRAALRQAAGILAHAGCAGMDEAARFRPDAARAIVAVGTRTIPITYGRSNPFDFAAHTPYVIAPVAGPHIGTLDTMMTQQSLATPAAVDAWCEKLEGFGKGFDAVTEKLRYDESLGVRPPAILSRKSLPILDALIAGEAARQPLLVALAERTRTAGITPKLRDWAIARAVAAYDRSARPAFRGLRDQVARQATRGRAEDGIWAQPDGAALYAANVRACGDTPLAPKEIHAIGLSETKRITAEMDALLGRQGLTGGSVGARMRALRGNPRFGFGDGDAGRAAALDHARALVRGAEARYPRILPPDLVPAAHLEVRRVPPAIEAGAPAAYASTPSLDGSVPGIFWLNLRDMTAVTKIALPTLSYHEGVPGHFTAGAIANALPAQPLLLQLASFNAYNEGWAVYGERMMAEIGAYADDPWGDLGRLDDELFRAVRLVVDTGLHELRWTRARAIAVMAEATGDATSEVTVEIERYMAWPGQALGYKLGQLRLLALREQMRGHMGARFDLRRFHRAVLGRGNLPLDLVEREVDRLSSSSAAAT